MAGRYRAYPAYKPSGSVWLGDIPEGWELWKIAHAYDEIGSGTTPPSDNQQWYDGDVPWVTTGELRDGIVFATAKSVSTKTIAAYPTLRIYPAGSIAIAMYGATIGRLGILGMAATTNQACCVIPKSDQIKNQYLYFWLQAFKNEIISLSVGGGQPNINQEIVRSLKVSCPSSAEQIQIAAFLDHETTKIDALIARQQRLIELLEEKRQAVISHAVTKGLIPNAPLRPSGIDWLGDIPAHWETRNISKITSKITNGYVGPTRDILVDEGVPYIQATHVKRGRVNFDNAYFVKKAWSERHSKSILNAEDVLIVQTGAGTGDVACVSSGEAGNNCHALIILTPMQGVINGRYLAFALRSQYGQAVLYSIRTGGMHPHLNCGEVQYVPLPLPPVAEQLKISDFIEDQTIAFDEMGQKIQTAITLLKERRTALISAAVTGKIDVRDWRSPSPAGNHDDVQGRAS
jgi:type I restriction enzyme S subunit